MEKNGMATRRILATLAALALGACQGSPSPGAASPAAASPVPGSGSGPGRAPAPPSATLRIHDGAGSSGPLELSSLTALDIETTYRGAAGAHVLRIDVLGPGGTLYAQLGGNLSAAADGTLSSRHVLEIAGTPIEAYHMVGTWRFRLTVDNAPLASAAMDILD